MAWSTVIQRITGRRGHETVLVIGGEVAKSLAERLPADRVTFASGSGSVVRSARRAGLDAYRIDPTDGSEFRELPFEGSAVVVATERDRVNLLASQLVRAILGVDTIVVWLQDSANRDLFDDLDVDLIDAQSFLSEAVRESLAVDDRG